MVNVGADTSAFASPEEGVRAGSRERKRGAARGEEGNEGSSGKVVERWCPHRAMGKQRGVSGGLGRDRGPERSAQSQLAENVSRSRGTGAREATRKGQKWAPSAMPFH